MKWVRNERSKYIFVYLDFEGYKAQITTPLIPSPQWEQNSASQSAEQLKQQFFKRFLSVVIALFQVWISDLLLTHKSKFEKKKTPLEKKREFCRVTFVEEEELVGAKFKIGDANAFLKRFTRRHKRETRKCKLLTKGILLVQWPLWKSAIAAAGPWRSWAHQHNTSLPPFSLAP